MHRASRVLGRVLCAPVLLLLAACGGSEATPTSIAGTWEFVIVGGGCPDLVGVLNPAGGPSAVFQVSQSGINVSSQFVDQVGAAGTLNATLRGKDVRGALQISTGGRTVVASIEGFARTIRGRRQVDGWVRIESDSLGECLGEIVEFCAIIDGDEDPLRICPSVDIVFVLDTSGSMDDEAAALCLELPNVEADLRSRGLAQIRTVIFGITETTTISETGSFAQSPEFDCLTDTVFRRLGGSVPNAAGVQVDILDPFEDESEEFWAPATAIIAARYPWLPDGALPTLRIVVPISDESPRTGARDCQTADFDSVANAINVALAHGVIVSPIIGFLDDQDPCIPQLGQNMATATGGRLTLTSDPSADLAGALFNIVVAACTGGSPPASPPPPPPPPPPDGELQDCPPIEIVFLMDTSASMIDDARALCDNIASVVAQLEAQGADVTHHILGITETQQQALIRLEADRQAANAQLPPQLQIPPLPANTFNCLQGSVLALLGGDVPIAGNDADVVTFDNPINARPTLPHYESWASATAIVAQRFDWIQPTSSGQPTPIRVIVPMSDEGPELGLSFFDPEFNQTIFADRGDCDDADLDAITNAIAVAQGNGVIVSPITAFLADLLVDSTGNTGQFHPCVVDEGNRLANGTGGTRFESRNPAADLATILLGLVRAACDSVGGPEVLIAFDRDGDMYFVDPLSGFPSLELDTSGFSTVTLGVISGSLYVPATRTLWVSFGGNSACQGCIGALNTATGEVTLVRDIRDAVSPGLPDLALRPDGFVFVPEGDSNGIFRLDPVTAVPTFVGNANGSTGRGLTFVGNTLYIVERDVLYTVDSNNGSATSRGALTLLGFPAPAPTSFALVSMTTRASDNAIFAILQVQGGSGGGARGQPAYLVRVDPLAVTAQLVGRLSFIDDGISVDVTLDGLAFVPSSLFVR